MRSVYFFIGGIVLAVLIVGEFPIFEQRSGRYQIILGKTPGCNDPKGITPLGEYNKMETMFRNDTATGQTWQLLTNPHTISYWYAIEGDNDPLLAQPKK